MILGGEKKGKNPGYTVQICSIYISWTIIIFPLGNPIVTSRGTSSSSHPPQLVHLHNSFYPSIGKGCWKFAKQVILEDQFLLFNLFFL